MEKHERPGRPTGLDLKFARLGRGIQAREIAASLGVSPQRISAIEAAFHPRPSMVSRYFGALDAIAPPEEARGAASSSGAAVAGPLDGLRR